MHNNDHSECAYIVEENIVEIHGNNIRNEVVGVVN